MEQQFTINVSVSIICHVDDKAVAERIIRNRLTVGHLTSETDPECLEVLSLEVK